MFDGVVGFRHPTTTVYSHWVGVGVAPVARAWDLALAGRPDLPLHSADGTHKSELGAFLTACVLFGRLTGENPAALAAYPYLAANEADRTFLAGIAAEALAETKP